MGSNRCKGSKCFLYREKTVQAATKKSIRFYTFFMKIVPGRERGSYCNEYPAKNIKWSSQGI